MTGSLSEAEELVQETFLRAWTKRGEFGGRPAPRAWLYRIATKPLPRCPAQTLLPPPSRSGRTALRPEHPGGAAG